MNYKVIDPVAERVPILLSVPHCGTEFPEALKSAFKPELMEAPDDTDWFVHKLYDFAPDMGITMIHARYSRWVIDLNRDPESKPLYSDGRIITALCPVTDFAGTPLYRDERRQIEEHDLAMRRDAYYKPYHEKLVELLGDLKNSFGQVLLWDCHSIRQLVPAIRKEKFPDLILGDADGTSASPGLSELTLQGLESSHREVSHNHPFKGGYITRHYGRPSENIHALQLEMTKVNYMNDEEKAYNPERAGEIRVMLKRIFESLVAQLT